MEEKIKEIIQQISDLMNQLNYRSRDHMIESQMIMSKIHRSELLNDQMNWGRMAENAGKSDAYRLAAAQLENIVKALKDVLPKE